eukprot:5494733-Pleurochrysis_carterae.AAC.1
MVAAAVLAAATVAVSAARCTSRGLPGLKKADGGAPDACCNDEARAHSRCGLIAAALVSDSSRLNQVVASLIGPKGDGNGSDAWRGVRGGGRGAGSGNKVRGAGSGNK